MTVEELINELMASCQSLNDDVMVFDQGIVTKVSGDRYSETVYLNDYEPVEKGQTQ
jgi:hypothetical protein